MKEEELIRLLMKTRVGLLGYIQSIVRSAELAEDIFQDVCVIAIEKRASLADRQNVVAWLYKSARFEALNRLRKRAKAELQLSDQLLDLMDVEFQKVEDESDSYILVNAIRHCLQLLSPSAQLLIQYRYTQGMDYSQIAAKVGRSSNSLYVTFCRIHASLARCVEKYRKEANTNG